MFYLGECLKNSARRKNNIPEVVTAFTLLHTHFKSCISLNLEWSRMDSGLLEAKTFSSNETGRAEMQTEKLTEQVN